MRPTTVDAVVIRAGKILLVKRGIPPFKGKWALPGGFVEEKETAEEAVARECREETGVKVKAWRLVGVYSSPKRDPKRKTIAVAFICKPVGALKPRGGDDAREAKWLSLSNLPSLAFDHSRIIRDATRLVL